MLITLAVNAILQCSRTEATANVRTVTITRTLLTELKSAPALLVEFTTF